MKQGPAFPRTRRDPMFPQFPGPLYQEPSRLEKAMDVLAIVLVVGAFAVLAVVGSMAFGA